MRDCERLRSFNLAKKGLRKNIMEIQKMVNVAEKVTELLYTKSQNATIQGF